MIRILFDSTTPELLFREEFQNPALAAALCVPYLPGLEGKHVQSCTVRGH